MTESTAAQRGPLGWLPGFLHLGLVGVLLLEVGLLRGRFDTERFFGDDRLWTRLLLGTRFVAPVGFATLTAWVLVGWKSMAREYRGLAHSPRSVTRSAVWSALHLAAFVVLHWLTDLLFGVYEGQSSTSALAWVGVWILGVLAVPFSAAAIAFPLRALGASLVRLLPSLLLATGIGLGAFFLSQAVLHSGLWFPLLEGTTMLSRWFLRVLTGEFPTVELVEGVEGKGFLVTVGGFWVLLLRGCSGVEGIALIWTFLAVFYTGFRARLRFPHALVLLPVATFLMWVANGLRVAVLVWIGARFSPDVALSGFHSYAGWMLFCLLALGVVYASQRIRWLARPGTRNENVLAASDTVNPTAVYLGPFLGILATSFVTGAFSAGFDALYPLRVVVGAIVLWRVRAELPRPSWRPSRTGLLFGGIAYLLWIGLESLGVQVRQSDASAGLAELSPAAAGIWLAFRALGFLLLAPVAEELAFRGFLARRLVAADFEARSYRAIPPFAWAISSLAFGVLHGQWIAGTLAGGLFGLAAMRRGRLGDAVVAHVVTNTLLLLHALVLGPWYGWI